MLHTCCTVQSEVSSLEIRVPPHWLITGLPIVEAIALPVCPQGWACYIHYSTASACFSSYCQHVSTHPDTQWVTLGAAV